MEARFCNNCGNTKDAQRVFKCDNCGKIYCVSCLPSQRCDSCKTTNGFFNANYTHIGWIMNKL